VCPQPKDDFSNKLSFGVKATLVLNAADLGNPACSGPADPNSVLKIAPEGLFTDGMFNSTSVVYTCATLDQINNFDINAEVFSARPAAAARSLDCPPGYRFSVTEVIPRANDLCLGYLDNLQSPNTASRVGPGEPNNRGYPDLWKWLDYAAADGPVNPDTFERVPDGTNQRNARMYCTNKALLTKKLRDDKNLESFTVYDLFSATKAARDELFRTAPKSEHLDAVLGAGKNGSSAGRTARYTTAQSDPGWTDTVFRQACYGYRTRRLKTGADLSAAHLTALLAWPETDTMCDSSTQGPVTNSDTMPDLLQQYITVVENSAGNFPTLALDDYRPDNVFDVFTGGNPLGDSLTMASTGSWKQMRCLSKYTLSDVTLQHSTCDRFGCRSDCCGWLAETQDYACCEHPRWKAPLRALAWGRYNDNVCDIKADCPGCAATFEHLEGELRYGTDSAGYPVPVAGSDGNTVQFYHLTSNCHRFRCATSATYTPGSDVLVHHKAMMLAETAYVTRSPWGISSMVAVDATCLATIPTQCTGQTTCDPSTCASYNVDYACIPPRDATSVAANKYVAFGFNSTSRTAKPFPAALRCPSGGPITVTEAGSSRDRLSKRTNTTAPVAALCNGKSSCAVPLAVPNAAAGDSTLKVTFSCACPDSRVPGYKAAQARSVSAGGSVSAGVASCVATKCDAGTFRTAQMRDCAPSTAGRAVGSPGATSDGPQCVPGSCAGEPGSTACELCAPGTFQSGSGALSCELCPANMFQNMSGSSSCTVCPPGFFSPVGARLCDPIPAGYYRSGDVSSPGVVTACSPGSFSRNASIPCAPCDPGTYASTPGLATCFACPLGTYSTGAASGCALCPDGAVTLQLGSTSADNCTVPDFLDWQRLAQTVTDCSALLLHGRPGMDNATLKAATLTRLQRQLGNGFCQGGPFNTAPCGWDGGDCCRATCRVPPPINDTLLADGQSDPSLLLGACSQQQLSCLDPAHAQASVRSARAGRDEPRIWLGQGVCGNPTREPTDAPSTASPTTESPTTVAPTDFPTAKTTDSPTTLAPSPYPTFKPTTPAPTTKNPTKQPTSDSPRSPFTLYPTRQPTAPTKPTTSVPSTKKPSAAPTKAPTSAPIAPTTKQPSTTAPSSAPTGRPSWLLPGLGDGRCDAIYNSVAFAYDNGDCDPRRGDGYCDVDLNTAVLDWDGGDCCWHTCRARLGLAGSCLLTDPSLCLNPNATDVTKPILKLYGKPVVCSNLACVDWPIVTAKDDDPCFSGAIEVEDVFSDCDGATKNCSTYTRSWRTWDAAGLKASLNFTARVNMAPPAPTPAPGAAPAADNTALTIGLAAAGVVVVLAAVATAAMIHKKRSGQQSTGSVGVELANTISATNSA
jgi:hypothetical protein